MKKETDLAWAAGFIDADGCIRIGMKKPYGPSGNITPQFYVEVSASQMTRSPLDKLKDMFGGSVLDVSRHKSKVNWQWKLSCGKAMECLEEILPYLVLKTEEAEVCIELQRSYGKRNVKGTSAEVVAFRQGLKDKVSTLKKCRR